MVRLSAIREILKRTSLLTVAFSLLAAWVLADAALFAQNASAAQIVTRSLAVSSSANGNIADGAPGTGGNGAQARHTFTFTEGTPGATIGSAQFEYCTTPLPGTACTAPAGLDVSTVTSVGGTTAAGWSVDAPPTANRIRVTRTASDITDTQNLIFGAGSTGTDYIKNPTTDNEEFFVRITTFSDVAWTTTVDQGTVANSTAEQIDITAKVQETLNFSVAGDDDTVDPATNACNPLTGSGAITLGDATDGVLSFQQAYDAHSYFRVSTNANNGTVVYYSGDTLTLTGSSEQIDPVDSTTAEASDVGTEQFGLAIDSADPVGADGYTFNSLVAATAYNNGDGTIVDAGTATFAFDTASVTTPVEIASSVGSPTEETIVCDTGSVRYLGNISTTTPPGIYTTTITYIAAPIY